MKHLQKKVIAIAILITALFLVQTAKGSNGIIYVSLSSGKIWVGKVTNIDNNLKISFVKILNPPIKLYKDTLEKLKKDLVLKIIARITK